MRIIVTQQGKDLIDCINSDNSGTHQSNSAINAFKGTSIPNLKSFNNTSSNIKKPSSINDHLNTQNKWNKNDLPNASINCNKKVPIRQLRMNIPKNISDKYNSINDTKETKSLLPHLPLNITRKIEHKSRDEKVSYSVNGQENKYNLTLRDAISDETLKTLKKSLQSRNLLRDKNFTLREDNFRTNYKVVDEYNNIQERINVQINPNHSNLITYLYSRKTLSDKFINKICNLPENNMTKLNRVCLKANKLEQKDEIYKKVIEEKMDNKAKEANTHCAKELQHIGESLKKYRDISQGYKVFSHKEALMDSLYMTKTNYWDKYDIERFYKRKDTKDTFTRTISVDLKQ